MIDDPQTQSSYTNLAAPSSTAVGGTGDPNYNQRIIPRQISTGTLRGTQNVGYGGTKIDSSNNTITLTNTDGTKIGMGVIPDGSGDFGFFSLDSTDNLIMKIVGGTMFVFDPQHSYVNVTQGGLLPDGSGGFVVAKPGLNVSDAF